MTISIVTCCTGMSAVVLAWAPVANPQSGSKMMTEWGRKVAPENVWREYPRPQMVRKNWTCLNGLWDYAVTTNSHGSISSPWAKDGRQPVLKSGKILVPFAVETPLSGVGHLLQPTELLWYRRMINVSPAPGERMLLHFGAVDFRCQVFIGHNEVTDVPHEGGSTPFTLDITDFVKKGENELTVCVWDPTTDFIGSTGKQVFKPASCYYTRMSGIWQTVWLESVPDRHIVECRTTPDLAKNSVNFSFSVGGVKSGERILVEVFDGETKVAEAWAYPDEKIAVTLPGPVKKWSPENPALYQYKATYAKDSVKGYFGMRTFEKRLDANGIAKFYLNGEPCFLYGPLDQGWWPDGFLTPPSEEAMEFEILTMKKMGFNMLRKHIKEEPARYYYLCDKLGIIVIQDMPNGRRDCDMTPQYAFYRKEFKDIVDSLVNFPSIVMWMPYNEGWSQPGEFFTHTTLDWIRRYDPTRLIGGPSGAWDYEGGHIIPNGWSKRILTSHKPMGECEAGDTVDTHIYRGPGMIDANSRRVSFLGEFGGLGHPVSNHIWRITKGNWGYGGLGDTATLEGLEKTYLGMVEELMALAKKGLGGAVYTQTTDVELEINGLMTYDRKVIKFDCAKLKAAHERLYKVAADVAGAGR